MTSTKGLTKDAGWELGVRRTVPAPLDEVWDYLLGEGLPLWLGRTELGRTKGDSYRTDTGTTGEIRGFTDRRRIRLTWRPAGWDHDSTLQLTVLEAAGGTTIAMHQERLASRAEREELLPHWHRVIDDLERNLAPE
jgi:uncharacterized protein YndB with AHSA1/START domain